MRFAGSAGNAVTNPAEIIKRMEEDKKAKELRALKFGVVSADAEKTKKEERLARFNIPSTPGAAAVVVNTDEQKAKIAERLARFGQEAKAASVNVAQEIKKGSLNFTLDDYHTKTKGLNKHQHQKKNGFKGHKKPHAAKKQFIHKRR